MDTKKENISDLFNAVYISCITSLNIHLVHKKSLRFKLDQLHFTAQDQIANPNAKSKPKLSLGGPNWQSWKKLHSARIRYEGLLE